MDRQLDMIWTNPNFFVIPKLAPGRLNGQDFISFTWPLNLPYDRYSVVIETIDTAGPRFRKIGKLNRVLELPHVKLDYADLSIGVIPDTPMLPSFEGMLYRGSSYDIPDTRGQNGKFYLNRHGAI